MKKFIPKSLISYTLANKLKICLTTFLCITAVTQVKAQFTVSITKLLTPQSDVGNGFISRTAFYGGNVLGGVGYNTFANGLAASSPMVVLADQDANVYVNRTYEFTDPVSNNALQVNSSRIIELADGTGYISVSAFELDRPSHPQFNDKWFGLLFMELDLSGNIVQSKKFVFPASSPFYRITPTDINVTTLTQLTINNPAVDEFVVMQFRAKLKF